MINEYYGVASTPTEDFLAHYGVIGMRWGVRKNPQKAFYKAMKRSMKDSLRKNKAAHKTVSSGAKTIGTQLPKNMVRNYVKASDQLVKAIHARENHEDRERERYQKTHKGYSGQELKRKNDYYDKLVSKEGRAWEQYDKVIGDAKNQLLGKYGNKNIRMDSHNTRMKRNANSILEAAFRSQMPERNPVKLNSNQKKLESAWKDAYQKYKDAPNGKIKRQLSEANTKAAGDFFDSMTEKQRKKYHDRYLY